MINTITQKPQEFPKEYNVFDSLPNENILYTIGRYLPPQDALSMRLVNKRFAVLFSDCYIWQVYYRSLGLEPPESNQNRANQLQLSNLAKQLSFWICLQNMINSKVSEAGNNVYRLESPRSHCITALVTPELAPLHSFAMKILQNHCNAPLEKSADELILSVAGGDRDFKVNDSTRILALYYLSKRGTEVEVRKVLLSVLNKKNIYGLSNDMFCRVAVKGFIANLTDPEVFSVVINCLKNRGAYAIKPALDTLIKIPEFLNAVISRHSGGTCGLNSIVLNHLNNPLVANTLLQRMKVETSLHLLSELARALKPILEQEPVQWVFCQKWLAISAIDCWHAKTALKNVFRPGLLTKKVKEEFSHRIDGIEDLVIADNILQIEVSKIPGQLQYLFTELSNESSFIREAAAKVLPPLVPNEPKVLTAFLDRIYARETGEACISIVSALAKVAHLKDVRNALIKESPLDGRLDSCTTYYNPGVRLATVEALRPFVEEPEVRQAFLERLNSDDSPKVRCALIDILAPQLDQEDVRLLFLKAAKDELWRQSYHSGSEWQALAIDKLGLFTDIPEVKDVLMELFEKNSFSVKAACIRSLCTNKQNLLISPEQIVEACMDRSPFVREEAFRVLALMVNN